MWWLPWHRRAGGKHSANTHTHTLTHDRARARVLSLSSLSLSWSLGRGGSGNSERTATHSHSPARQPAHCGRSPPPALQPSRLEACQPQDPLREGGARAQGRCTTWAATGSGHIPQPSSPCGLSLLPGLWLQEPTPAVAQPSPVPKESPLSWPVPQSSPTDLLRSPLPAPQPN